MQDLLQGSQNYMMDLQSSNSSLIDLQANPVTSQPSVLGIAGGQQPLAAQGVVLRELGSAVSSSPESPFKVLPDFLKFGIQGRILGCGADLRRPHPILASNPSVAPIDILIILLDRTYNFLVHPPCPLVLRIYSSLSNYCYMERRCLIVKI